MKIRKNEKVIFSFIMLTNMEIGVLALVTDVHYA